MHESKKGSALLLATILLFVVLSMVVSLTYVTVMEQKMSGKTKSSVGSFFNADSGIEWALNQIANSSGTIASVFSGIDPASGKKSCPDFGSGSPCVIYLLDSAGKVINSTNPNSITTASDISEVKAVRSVGSQTAGGEATQRAIEAAVAAGGEGGNLIVFGTTSCPSGWTQAYSGTAAGLLFQNYVSDTICVQGGLPSGPATGANDIWIDGGNDAFDGVVSCALCVK
ncbi:MAG: pilus assembly PilX N-terminal domain-containing protein [Patescibacteria group bacterium]|nr:pilus assembly PilX N-terminal domain-containing protein [Patescibacteria group bacterium]